MAEEAVIVRALSNAEITNEKILQQFKQYRDDEDVRRSHFFADRYENIYLGVDRVPAMQTVMEQAMCFAQEILGTSESLKAGFWFNVMKPGELTQRHTHDDDDECLSAVYYINTPKNAGNLLLNIKSEIIKISPSAGQFVFFPPHIPHQVTENKSNDERLSVGINFGPNV